MTIFVATYRYSAPSGALAALRPQRFAYFARMESEGHLLASGQLLDGELGDGMLILNAPSQKDAHRLLGDDPFVREGYVSRLEIVAWNPTTGAWIQ